MPIIKDEIDYIDPDSKEVVYKSGRKTPLSEKAAFSLFSSPSQKQVREGVKGVELEASEATKRLTGSPALNTFVKNLTDNVFTRFATDYALDPAIAMGAAFRKGEGQEEKGIFGRAYENYIAQRMGRRDAREIMDRESPTAAALGQIGALGLDIATPLPKAISSSPLRTGAAFGFAGSDRSLLEDPAQVAKSTAVGGGIGYVAGKAVGGLQRVAGERRALRAYREAEVAQKEAQELAKKGLPKLTAEEKKAYDSYVAQRNKALGRLDKEIGPYKVSKEGLDVDRFLAEEVGVSAQAGTREANEAVNFLGTIEASLPEKLATRDVQRMYEAIDGRIAQSASELETSILERFKQHITEVLPEAAATQRIADKYGLQLEKNTVRSIEQYVDSLPGNIKQHIDGMGGSVSTKSLKQSLVESVKEQFAALTPYQMREVVLSGDAKFINQALENNELFQYLTEDFVTMQGRPVSVPGRQESKVRLLGLLDAVEADTAKVMDRVSPKAYGEAFSTKEKIGSTLANASGVQSPVTGKMGTNISISRTPVQVPQLGQKPEVGRMAERFETQPLRFGKRSTQGAGLYGLGKFLGVPGLGKIGLAAKGGAAAMEGVLRGLTSPGAMAERMRNMASRDLVKVVVSEISSYPSYQNGVLTDPNDRRLAVANIEQNPYMQLQDKAMVQTYINRGKSLEKFED